MRQNLRQVFVSVRAFLVFTVVLCLLYPAAVYVVAQLGFKDKANGSIVEVDGHAAGSSMLAQDFVAPKYFWPRPSAAGAGYDGNGYAATSSGGSNAGPTSDKLLAPCLPVPAVDDAGSPGDRCRRQSG